MPTTLMYQRIRKHIDERNVSRKIVAQNMGITESNGALKGKNKAQGGKRVMYTTHTTSWDAKNRYGLPDELPFEYAQIAHIIERTGGSTPQAVMPTTPACKEARQTNPQALADRKTETPDAYDELTDDAALNAMSEACSVKPEVPAQAPTNLPKALYDLMVKDGVTEPEIMFAVAGKGYYPNDTPVSNYDPSFVWGCAADGHEVYACALGDPKNWNQFIGQATDSYAANVGSPGLFTGAAAHLGNVYFFKADCIHQLMGTKPANFTMNVMQTRGVGASNSRSLIRVNERLYFKSDEEICAFGSSLPIPISENLPRLGGHAVGGAIGSRCFWCVDAPDGSREIIAYDTRADCWVREDEADAQRFAALDGRLYMLKTNGEIWCMTAGANDYDGADAADEAAVEWALETGDFGLDAAYNKYISGIQLHGDVDLGATLRVQIRYDMHGVYEEVYRSAPLTRQSLTIPLTPKRCHSLRLRLCGTGGVRLYSIVMRTEAGSDVYAAT